MDSLQRALESAVSHSLWGERHAGILFSGGLDSAVLAFLAKKSGASPVLITAGMEGSEDLRFARTVAAELGMELESRTIGDDEVASLYRKAKAVSGETDLMKVELGMVLLACCEAAQKRGIRLLIFGSGAEELFLGYHEHLKRCVAGEDLDALRRRELAGLAEKDLRRSGRIAAHFGIRLALPYLDEAVVKAVLSTPAAGNFKGGENKAVLRSLARELGVPEPACSRPKRAMQYGSGVHKAVSGLTKKGEF